MTAYDVTPGGEWEIRYEVALTGQFSELWARKQELRAASPSTDLLLELEYTAALEGVLAHARTVLDRCQAS